MSFIEIKDTKRYGRGLFAARNIKKGQLIEISPVIEVYSSEINSSKLNLYTFGWRNSETSALALGLGSLFNHSSKRHNVTYQPCFTNKNITFFASKDIKKNHQLFINYGYDPKQGIEVTERNIFNKLKQKFEPKKFESQEPKMLSEIESEYKATDVAGYAKDR